MVRIITYRLLYVIISKSYAILQLVYHIIVVKMLTYALLYVIISKPYAILQLISRILWLE
jgi:hypothetical protein